MSADSSSQPATVLAVVDDLFVRGRIDATAAAVGVTVRYVSTIQDIRAAIGGAAVPHGLLVGMAATRTPWAELIRQVRADPSLPRVHILAFGPHKNLALRSQALDAGADRVVANSTFVRMLPTLLATPEPDISDTEDEPS